MPDIPAVPAHPPAVRVNPDVPLTAARENWTDLVHTVGYSDSVTFLTRHGTRVVALVPVHIAEQLEAAGSWVDAPMSDGKRESFISWLGALDASLGEAARPGS